jgi:hypothetical protein
MGALVAGETPLHEGLHALTATIMPHVKCTGIALSDKVFYAHVLKYLTFGYVQPETLPAGVAGYAKIAHSNDLLGNAGYTITSAIPEFVTMTAGIALTYSGIQGTKTKGKRMFGTTKLLTGSLLLGSSIYYMKMSMLNPQPGQDYYGMTSGALQTIGIPTPIADISSKVLTVAGCAGFLYLVGQTAGKILGIKGKDENQGGQSVMDKWRKKQQERQKQRQK